MPHTVRPQQCSAVRRVPAGGHCCITHTEWRRCHGAQHMQDVCYPLPAFQVQLHRRLLAAAALADISCAQGGCGHCPSHCLHSC